MKLKQTGRNGGTMAAEVITLRDSRDLGRQPHLGMQQNDQTDFAPTKTPGINAGSFLIDPMTGKQAVFTPIDETSGLCLPIITNRQLPRINQSAVGGVIKADWNHNFHPKRTLISGSKLENALRNSRAEWVHRDDHVHYHGQYYGPDISKIGDLIRPIIFAAAGYIPEHGMQYDGRREAKMVAVNWERRRQLWTSGQIKVVSIIMVRDALVERALSRDFNGINDHTIDEFLNTQDHVRRFELGNSLLSLAVYDMVSPIKLQYANAHNRHLLPDDVPQTVGRFATRLIIRSNITRALNKLSNHLQAA